MHTVFQTSIPDLPLVARGKVRDVYAVGDDQLLLVATDRISAFDCILGSPIPGKGVVLTQVSLFWFELLRDLTPNHLLSADVADYPAKLHKYRDQLEGRSMLVKRARMVEIECVARGYLAGSGWKEYKQSQSVCGIPLPAGILERAACPSRCLPHPPRPRSATTKTSALSAPASSSARISPAGSATPRWPSIPPLRP